MTMSITELILLPINTFYRGKNRRDTIVYGKREHMAYDEYPSASGDAPLVIFWYGGSWKNGRKEMYRFVGHALQRMGVHAFVVDYPKYPARVYPGFLDDAVAAVDHIKRRYPGRKTILMGHSAGGHTALLLGMQQLVTVESVAALAAPSSINERYWRPVFGDAIREGLTDPRNYAATVPDELSMLLVHGTNDTVVAANDSISLHEKLRANGKKSQLILVKQLNHILILPFIMLGLAPAIQKQLQRYLLQ